MKRLLSVILAVIFILPLVPNTALAAELGPSNLTVIIKSGEEALSGINLSVCRVADAKEESGNIVFEVNEKFAGSGADFSEELTPKKNVDQAAALNIYAAVNNIERIEAATGSTGKAEFENLPAGLYLVAQVDSATSEYTIAPYLVSVPMRTEDGTGWYYSVIAYPKTEPVKREDGKISIGVYKVWKTTTDSLIGIDNGILVQLYKNEVKFGSPVTINEHNYWHYVWEGLDEDADWTVDEIGVPTYYEKVITGDKSTGFVITNTYSPAAKKIDINAEKSITGETTHKENQFRFALINEDGNVVALATNSSNGTITFKDLVFDTVGVFNYTVVECGLASDTPWNVGEPAGQTAVDQKGWTFDRSIFKVTVTVTDTGGALAAGVDYSTNPNSEIKFSNKYETTGSLTLTGTKTATGKDLANGMFSFTIKENDKMVVTGTSAANGDITFGKINYSAAGKHVYVISEDEPLPAGWYKKSSPVTVYVNVTDDGEGKLTATAYSDSEYSTPITNIKSHIKFDNLYAPDKAIAEIKGDKSVTGKALTAGQFRFALVDGNNKVIALTTNSADGTVTFSGLAFDAVKTYTYTMIECGLASDTSWVVGETAGTTSANKDGWTFDRSKFEIKIEVTDIGGKLQASVSYPEAEVLFTNVYTPGTAEIKIKKVISGRADTSENFNFNLVQVADQAGGSYTAGTPITRSVSTSGTITSAAGQELVFATITGLDAGKTYYFKITEAGGSAPGWLYSSESYIVTVTENGNGTTTVTYPSSHSVSNPPVFTNTYATGITKLKLAGTKTATGASLIDGEFSFAVYEDNTQVSLGTNTAAGELIFNEITYTAPGEHTYTVRETSHSGNGWTTDDTVHTVNVSVKDNGDGTLTATATYPASGLVFHNTYTPPEEPNPKNVSIRISKSLIDTDGNQIGNGKKFAIRIYDSAMHMVDRVILSANEESVLISGLESGTTYYLQEEEGKGFTVLSFEIVGVATMKVSAVGIRIPLFAADNTEIQIVVTNRADDITEIPDEPPPLGPYPTPDPPIVDIPEEEVPLDPGTPSTPKTGNEDNLILWWLLCTIAAVVLISMTVASRPKEKRKAFHIRK